jgi:Na+-translocating ferredoxin:NAD+ oxidoreductase subunit E
MSSYKDIFKDGLWKKNPGLVQLLGLCPLLAVSSTATNALSLGLATVVVLSLSNFLISLVRNIVIPEVRIIIYVVIIASLVTCVQLLMQAFTPELYTKLGLYIALIVTNCIIIGRAEMFAAKNTPIKAFADGIANGVGFTLVLLCIGMIREIVGQGTVFAGLSELIGKYGENLTLTLFSSDQGLLIAILPPGAFFSLGLLLALKNFIDCGFSRKKNSHSPVTTVVEKDNS